MTSDLNRKVALQRASLFWEKLWHAAQKPLLVLGLAIFVLASGLSTELPKYFELGLLAIWVCLFLYSLKDLFQLKAPHRIIAMRRMETASNITHRGISSHDDNLVAENSDANTTSLWEEHQRRTLAKLETVKVVPPTSAWRSFDPLALRVPVAAGALAAFLLGPGDLLTNMRNAASLSPAAPAPALTIDAWLRPPAYTGKPPLLLSSAAMQDRLASGSDLVVPENSNFTLRVDGADHPRLAFYTLGEPASPETEIKNLFAKSTPSETGFSGEVRLERPALVKLYDGSKELASWPIALIPDESPKIKITSEPKTEKQGALSVAWEASDDYGVKSITAEISLSDQQENGPGFAQNGVFLFDPPVFKMALKKPNAKSEQGTSVQDLTSHPWAGLFVEITLTATDGAGHTTTTKPSRFQMPERSFFKPLAKAVVEQRKNLILSPDEAPNVATMFDSMLAYPYSIRDQSRLVLRLAAIKASLANAGDTDTVTGAVTELWPLAVAIEDGQLSDVRAELRALKQELEQALRDGAPPEKIAELMDKMRKAMDRLMSQMEKEAQRRQADGSQQDGREITKDELQKMLDQIERLSKQGSKDAAQQLLSQLDKLLQNLQPGSGQAMDPNGDPGLQQKMDDLSDLMRRQQQLMDETQRMGPNGDGDQQGDQSGSRDHKGKGPLSDRQGGLSDRLDKLGKDLGGNMFGDAQKNMKDAQGSLKNGSKEDALKQQGDAMKGMLEGAKKLGRKLAEQGQGQTGEKGKDGTAATGNDDPLGRPRATHSPDQGADKNVVPSELAMRRAREILEQLRNRSNDQGLSETEKTYIERLLKGLY